MLRFFRKYQKYILAVGGSILMVIFLVPTAITSLGQYSARQGRTIATFTNLAGEVIEVTSKDYEDAQKQMRILKESVASGGPLLGSINVELAEHWMLIVHEARQHQLIGGQDDARRLIEQFAQSSGQANAINPDVLAGQLAQAAGTNIPGLYDALAHLIGVERLFSMYRNAGRLSDVRMHDRASKVLVGIDAKSLVIAASPSEEGLPEPTEAELQAQLDKYAEYSLDDPEHLFGYRLQNQARLEWLHIDTDGIKKDLADSERLSELELRKYWVRNKLRFPDATIENIEDVKYEDVKEQVRTTLLQEVTREAMENISRFIDGELLRTTRNLTRDGSYLALPDDWAEKRVQLDQLALGIQNYILNNSRFGVSIPLPTFTRMDRWYSEDQISELPPRLRSASTDKYGNQPVSLRVIIPALKEFGGSNQVFVQAGVSEMLFTAEGNSGVIPSIYLVRVIDTEPSRPAKNVDEVRDDLVRDLKKIAHYGLLAQRVGEIKQRAINEGLNSLKGEFGGIVLDEVDVGSLPQTSLLRLYWNKGSTRFVPPVSDDKPTIEKVVSRGKELLERLLQDNLAFESLSIEDRTMVIPVPDKLALVVIQYSDLRPAIDKDSYFFLSPLPFGGGSRYSLETSPIGQSIYAEELGEDPLDQMEYFTYDTVIARYSYESSRDDSDEKNGNDTEGEGETVESSDDATESSDESSEG